ncbi:MAG: hypothetical protein H0V25_11625 [Solirubrobacterales bacterium]|nr:hypothetical protein [Solirubrobacterales bacterium]
MRAVATAATFALTVVAAALIGFGVPLAWVWIGSQMQGDSGATSVSFSVAMAILFGIIVSYVLLLYLAGVVMSIFDSGEQEQPSATSRAPWMRGQSESRPEFRRQTINSIERVFVATAVVVTVAFWLWFAFLAGSPLPNQ